jgi:eukaryotic-like serine/threonine-protein kinase
LAIVHRDVSPQNILASFDGTVKIADFGIASANLFREEQGVLKGKFGYMSPEQARGDPVDRRSDIYALGVCLFELLTARSLHMGLSGDDLLEVVRRGEVEPPSTYVTDIPPELEEIVMRALEKNREDRFQTARDMSGAISRTLLLKQQLIDAASIEAVVDQLVGREHTSPGLDDHSEIGNPAVHGSSHFSTPSGDDSEHGSEAPHITRAAVPMRRPRTSERHRDPPAKRGPREVRHVAVVTFRLFGMSDLIQEIGAVQATYVTDRIKRTLGDIAYKRGAELQWETLEQARAVVGLLANSSQAAAEAAGLAIDVHEALAGISSDLPVDVQASIGIVRGIASGERDTEGRLMKAVLQQPANMLVHLLGEQAPKGSTWVAGGLYRLVRRNFRWADAPTIDLTVLNTEVPLPRVMRTHSLLRPLSKEERHAELAMAPNDLMGRDAEKADLHTAFHQVTADAGEDDISTVISRAVVGEVGIGKTALVNTFLAELPPTTRVIRIEASPARTELPYAAISDFVREMVGLEGDQLEYEKAREIIQNFMGPLPGNHGQILIQRLTELATGSPFSATDEEELVFRRKLIASALRRLLGGFAGNEPLIIVADALQWADKPSLELLSDLIRPSDAVRIFALLVTRSEERVMPYLEGIVRIDLRGLSREDQIRLVEARLGVQNGVADVCADLLPRVAGNPFFLLEMIDALLERGSLELALNKQGEQMLVRTERAGETRDALPSTLEQIIGDRLSDLPKSEAEVVNWLAIAGTPLTRYELEQLTGTPIEDDVMRLCARGICEQRGGSMEFRHTIAREVAYQAIEPSVRRKMHRGLGEYLAKGPMAQGLSAALVARHLGRGDSPTLAGPYYLEAAQSARNAYQTQLATRYYQRALAFSDPKDPRRMRAHEALEAIYRVLGRRHERKKHLNELRKLASQSKHPRWVAVALARTVRLDLDESNITHGLMIADKATEAARLARDPVIEIETENIMSELRRDSGDMAGALAACDRALAVCQTNPNVPARARAEVLRSRGVLLRHMGRVTEAVEDYAEAIAVFRKCGARRQEARAKNALSYAMVVLEKWEDAIALGLSSIGIDLSIGGRFQIAKTLANVGQSYARLGDFPRALAYLQRARDAHERYGDQDKRADTLLVTAEILLEAGDLDAARTMCNDAGSFNAVKGNQYDTIHEKLVRALVARAEGDPASAMMNALDARQQAEGQALASFHLYATAIEALCKIEIGEVHTGILLASTAISAVDNIPTEYGIEIRAHACEAFERSLSPSASMIRHRCASHILGVAERIRSEPLRRMFLERKPVQFLLGGSDAVHKHAQMLNSLSAHQPNSPRFSTLPPNYNEPTPTDHLYPITSSPPGPLDSPVPITPHIGSEREPEPGLYPKPNANSDSEQPVSRPISSIRLPKPKPLTLSFFPPGPESHLDREPSSNDLELSLPTSMPDDSSNSGYLLSFGPPPPTLSSSQPPKSAPRGSTPKPPVLPQEQPSDELEHMLSAMGISTKDIPDDLVEESLQKLDNEHEELEPQEDLESELDPESSQLRERRLPSIAPVTKSSQPDPTHSPGKERVVPSVPDSIPSSSRSRLSPSSKPSRPVNYEEKTGSDPEVLSTPTPATTPSLSKSD